VSIAVSHYCTGPSVEGKRIDDSFICAIFAGNANGVKIVGNTIGQTFLRGAAFGAGDLYGVVPMSAIYVGRARNAEIRDNSAARSRVAKAVVALDRTCDRSSVRVGMNRLT
jgi:hypothetical protein